MRFSLPAAVLAIASLTSGFTIPEGLAEGVYTASINDDGTHNFTLISDTPSAPSVPALSKRATTWPSGTKPVCTGGTMLGHYDFYDGGAWGNFWSHCQSLGGTKIGSGSSIFSYWGNAVAYMCAYGPNPCSVVEWGDAVNWAQNACPYTSGAYVEPAYLNIPSWKKSYGYTNSKTSFC
ncbi:hypothetical protein P153DRAFT_358301 [Dothidotthia symphoricarpi CBS 119687]|uniref:Lytic polysaccharide monooxygenase n=1 Tax=Dothidotthia symphoricarpi CBS 119687 TaxID=1392245 RepID=A0A6A6AAF1_9PLEO|nr:uncharacterized protein P153DRAFT_358301 [Dothidotthia symphoricarpi CBS 119687]KAF2128193.1 hypothetical protein P153DRAFT_358301 [Dothidotthia symphoricarpi CBS 119687]